VRRERCSHNPRIPTREPCSARFRFSIRMRRVNGSRSTRHRSSPTRHFRRSVTIIGLQSRATHASPLRGLLDVLFNLPIAQVNRAMRERRDIGFVRHEDDGVAGLMQAREERHDLGARF